MGMDEFREGLIAIALACPGLMVGLCLLCALVEPWCLWFVGRALYDSGYIKAGLREMAMSGIRCDKLPEFCQGAGCPCSTDCGLWTCPRYHVQGPWLEDVV